MLKLSVAVWMEFAGEIITHITLFIQVNEKIL